MTGAAKLSGGASQETWTFDIVHPSGNVGAILRRAPLGYGASPGRAAGLDAEATLMQLAHDAGLPSPRVMHVLKPEDELGRGFIMQRIEGETIARKILRDEQFAKARPILARQLGRVIARHSRLSPSETAEIARDERDEGDRRPRAGIPQLQLAAAGVRAGATLAA
ncbi:phosphotransferase [Bradyrhizobium sp. AZCC 1614]|uniref:phosphotransferase n=1 Tax=Bradyrhizobium sp. AZCC 1614 TaxID=3117017 RepID=UPI002FF20BF2